MLLQPLSVPVCSYFPSPYSSPNLTLLRALSAVLDELLPLLGFRKEFLRRASTIIETTLT